MKNHIYNDLPVLAFIAKLKRKEIQTKQLHGRKTKQINLTPGFKKLWDFSRLMSGDYRWWIIMMILFIHKSQCKFKTDRLLAFQTSYWRNLSSKIFALRYSLTSLPMRAGRQAILSWPYSSPVTFHKGGVGGCHRKRGGGYLRSEHQAGCSMSMNNPQKDISVGTVTTDIVHKKAFTVL